MALRTSATMALLIFSLMAVAHCVPLEADHATNAASAAVTTVPNGEEEGLLRFPSRDDRIVSDVVVRDGEVPGEEEVVQPVAEPDPDRSHPDSDGEEELTAAKKLGTEGQQDDEKTEEEEEKTTRKSHGGDKEEKKKRKKHHDCDGKEKKEMKMKKHRRSSDDEEEEGEEEKTKKKIHRHHHVGKTKTKKLTRHNKNNGDDEDEQEKREKRWRKAISRSMLFGRGRRSQREEAAKDEVNN